MPELPVMPLVLPVTQAGVVPRAVPTRNGCVPEMPAALNVYVAPALSEPGSAGLKL